MADITLEKRIEKLEAVGEVRNLIGRYEAYHFIRTEIPQTTELFALWREDCSVEIGELGLFLGTERVVDFWEHTKPDNTLGASSMHLASTPVIEIAGNGKTAKAIFQSMGYRSGLKDGVIRDAWTIGKYAADFVKNPKTGEWKIWHLQFLGVIQTPFHSSFVENMQAGGANRIISIPGSQPVHHGAEIDLSGEPHPFPLPPTPYEDYDGTFRWQYGGALREERYGVEYGNLETGYNRQYPEKI